MKSLFELLDPKTIFNTGIATSIILFVSKNLTPRILNEFFERRKFQINSKRDLAKQITLLLSEAEANKWTLKPKSMEHTVYIQNAIYNTNKRLYAQFKKYIELWSLYAYSQMEVSKVQKMETTIPKQETKKILTDLKSLNIKILDSVGKWR